VASMWTCPGTSQPMVRRSELRCVAGMGVEGDRYSLELERGRYSGSPEPGRQLTLIAEEGMERLRRKHGLDIGPESSRRNVVTRGIRLADLVGHELRIGELRVFAHRATVPCMYLEGLLRQKGLFEELYYDAGLCCEILEGGRLAEGDAVAVVAGSCDPGRCRSWPCKALFVRPRERTSAQRADVLAFRGQLQAQAELDPLKKKRLRLFDQAFGRKNEDWDGGSPQW